MKLKDKKRQNIIDAAVEEFSLHGFEAARIDDIAKRAQVSKRTLYNHFTSKQVLFDAIVEVVMARVTSIETPGFSPTQPLRDQLIFALKAYVDVITEPRYLSINRLLAAEYMRDQELAKQILLRPELYVSPVSNILEHAMEAGQLRQSDPDIAASQILGLIKNFYFWPQFLLNAEQNKSPEMMEDCLDMFLNHHSIN